MKVPIRTELLKTLRRQAGWTQEQLAELAGLHIRTIQRMENEGLISPVSLVKVAKVFQIEVQELEQDASRVDFAPSARELRKLGSALFRKIAPTTSQGLPRFFSA